MDRIINSLFVFLLFSFFFFFTVSISTIVSPDLVVVVPTADRNTSTTSSEEDLDLLKGAETHFTNFVKKFGKIYADQDEHVYRLSVFKSNLRRAKRHQKLDPTAVHGITQFSDLTPMEFRRKLLGHNGGGVKRVKLLQNGAYKAPILPTNNLPSDFDWRDRGAVTSVKNELYCGSNYAFSATGAIESANYLARGQLVDLSEQQIVDCSYRKYAGGQLNGGCNGGWPFASFQYAFDTGLVSEAQYPYYSGRTQKHGACRVHGPSPNVVRVANFSEFRPNDEDQIVANLVKNGPLAVITYNKLKFLHTYIGGVSCPYICAKGKGKGGDDDGMIPDHSVLLVGYGAGAYSPIRLKEEPYWIFKNSWGPEWGEMGFFRSCRGSDVCGGIFAVYTVATVP